MKKKIIIALVFISILLLVGLGINVSMVKGTEKNIVASIEGEDIDIGGMGKIDADCIIVPGAGVNAVGKPSKMLADRLDFAVYLYKAGVAPKLLLSGDNGQTNYNEVAAMQKYVLDKDVPGRDVFLDHAGFSTYDTMFRAKEVFQVNSAVVVTQRYHLHRTLYVGDKMGIKVYGGAADQKRYVGQERRDAREILAREKDFFKCIFMPDPTFLGEPFPISGDGRRTWN